MEFASISHKIASWTLVLGGLGHTFADLFSPTTAERIDFIHQMKAFTAEVLGVKFNMFLFHQGFSLMMGLLLFGYGALNLMILNNKERAHLPSNVLLLNMAISLVTVILSVKYFFFIPVMLTSIALIGYSVSYLLKLRTV